MLFRLLLLYLYGMYGYYGIADRKHYRGLAAAIHFPYTFNALRDALPKRSCDSKTKTKCKDHDNREPILIIFKDLCRASRLGRFRCPGSETAPSD